MWTPGYGPVFNENWDNGAYAARSRPLNRYLYAGSSLESVLDSSGQDTGTGPAHNLPLFQCKADNGYPEYPASQVEIPDLDAPKASAERSCYDTLGNSYRASLAHYRASSGPTPAFAFGPWGHRLSTIESPARTILLGEPRFFDRIGLDAGGVFPDPYVATGWHKKLMVDNILYVDASARPTNASNRGELSANDAALMGICAGGNGQAAYARGSFWQIDVYPTPGARIRGVFAGTPTDCWPWMGAQDNLRPN